MNFADPIQWWEAAGFKSEEDVPFFSKKLSIAKYGKWEEQPRTQSEIISSLDYYYTCFPLICDECKASKSAAECLDIAERIIQTSEVRCIYNMSMVHTFRQYMNEM